MGNYIKDKENYVVIGERYNKIGLLLLIPNGIFFIFSVIGCIFLSIWLISVLILFFIGLLMGLYILISPQNALIKINNNLKVRYLFATKIIPISNIQYVSYNEKGSWYNRDVSFWSAIVLKNDIRIVTITYVEDGELKHKKVLLKDACAVKTSIDCLIENKT